MATTETSAERLSIGEVAEQTGLSVHALRFYEREGWSWTGAEQEATRLDLVLVEYAISI